MSGDRMRGALPDGQADVAIAARGRIAAEPSSYHEGLEQSVAEHIVDLAAANAELAVALKELEGLRLFGLARFAGAVARD